MTDTDVCGAAHPNAAGVTCELPTGPNAETDPVYDFDENGQLKWGEDGNPVVLTPGTPVHVHKGYDASGDSYRWEDVPETP